MWKLCQFCYILLHLYASSSSQEIFHFPREFRVWIFDTFGRTNMGEMYLQMARNANMVQDIVPDYVPFLCNVTGGRSSTVPNSVHKLKPGDIDVIAAMGDSFTAGAGILASNLFQVLVENRGITALGGGEGTWREYLTLPNIIKEFNPNLIGYALGDSLTSHEASQLNVAESGAMSENMPYMAEILIEKIKKDSRIDLHKHWKLISLMIGDNDICSDICWLPSPWSILEKHKVNMLQVLRTLRDNLPRTFVSLVSPPHIRALVETRKGRSSFQCAILTDFMCPCILGLTFQPFKPMYYDIMRRFEDLNMEIAAYPEFQKDDFVVVVQPVIGDTLIPLALDGYSDMTYLSADCVHLSQKFHARMANGVWNNLLEPVGTKRRELDHPFEIFHCPTPDRPYLATMLNSIYKTNKITNKLDSYSNERY